MRKTTTTRPPKRRRPRKRRSARPFGRACTKLKILIAVSNTERLLWTLPYVSYPDAFEALVSWMSFIELDFVRIVPVCVEIKILRQAFIA